jgi:hypothetical protein
MNKCDSCDHKEVCSKKEAYKEAFDKVNKDIGEFEVELKCKYYKNTPLAQQLNDYYKKQQEKPWTTWPNPYIGDVIGQYPKVTW